MAYNEFIVDRVRARLYNKGQLEEKKMMGGLVFMLNGKMCVGVDIDKRSQEDRLMLRVGKENFEKLLELKGATKMDFTGRPMKGYIFVYPLGFDDDKDFDFWIDKAVSFNKELISEQ